MIWLLGSIAWLGLGIVVAPAVAARAMLCNPSWSICPMSQDRRGCPHLGPAQPDRHGGLARR